MHETISILLPTYNRKMFIMDAVKSILQQTYKNINLLIYDDGSTDGTIDLLKTLSDKRIKLYRETSNKGVAYARNQLLDFCETEYAAWQDSDDVSNIYRIEYQEKQMQQTKGLIYTRYQKLTEQSQKLLQEHPVPYYKHGANASAMFIVNKEILFKDSLLRGEDEEWLSRMKQKYNQAYVDYILYYVRFHNDRLGVMYKNYKWQDN